LVHVQCIELLKVNLFELIIILEELLHVPGYFLGKQKSKKKKN